MARGILTDSELRARWRGEREITLSPGTIVTPRPGTSFTRRGSRSEQPGRP